MDMIICPKCRAKLGDGSTVCVVCGTSLTAGQPAPAKAPEPAIPPAAPATPALAPATAPPPAVAAAPPQVQVDLAEKPLEEKALPDTALVEEKPPVVPPPAQPPQQPPQQQPPAQQPPKPAAPPQKALPPQQPPPPDHPMYQQQYQQQPAQGNWNTHPYVQGQPNQCPRCHVQNVVQYYGDGTGYCGSCYYRFYWRPPSDSFDTFGRELDHIFG